ncbi:MAG: hypothetical protein HY961_09295 [Ignavibacteriae bacterium]|nr:hypothetical protein [Ignavibacteriota bacterium]
MNRIPAVVVILAVVAALLSFAASAMAKEKSNEPLTYRGALVSTIEENLTIGMKHYSPGVRLSAIRTARDLKALYPQESFDSFVIPLMTVLKDKNAPSQSRILAALALHDLRTARGDFAISQTALFTDDSRLANACAWLVVERRKEELAGC